MTQPYSFSKEGARRVINAVRTVEGNDLLRGQAPSSGRRRHAGPEQFIIARITDVDTNDPTLVSATEQFWDDTAGKMIDLPGGRVWDGESGNPTKVKLN